MPALSRPPKVGDVWGGNAGLTVWLILAVEGDIAKYRFLRISTGEAAPPEVRQWTFGTSMTSHKLYFNIFDDINWPKLMEEIK